MSLLLLHLERKVDHSHVSGTGRVAEGVLFVETGEVVIQWLSDHPSTIIFHSLADLEAIHGHNGDTIVVFDKA